MHARLLAVVLALAIAFGVACGPPTVLKPQLPLVVPQVKVTTLACTREARLDFRYGGAYALAFELLPGTGIMGAEMATVMVVGPNSAAIVKPSHLPFMVVWGKDGRFGNWYYASPLITAYGTCA